MKYGSGTPLRGASQKQELPGVSLRYAPFNPRLSIFEPFRVQECVPRHWQAVFPFPLQGLCAENSEVVGPIQFRLPL